MAAPTRDWLNGTVAKPTRLLLLPIQNDRWLLQRILYKSSNTVQRMPHYRALAGLLRVLARTDAPHLTLEQALASALVPDGSPCIPTALVTSVLLGLRKLVLLAPALERRAQAAFSETARELGAARYGGFCVIGMAIAARARAVAVAILADVPAIYARLVAEWKRTSSLANVQSSLRNSHLPMAIIGGGRNVRSSSKKGRLPGPHALRDPSSGSVVIARHVSGSTGNEVDNDSALDSLDSALSQLPTATRSSSSSPQPPPPTVPAVANLTDLPSFFGEAEPLPTSSSSSSNKPSTSDTSNSKMKKKRPLADTVTELDSSASQPAKKKRKLASTSTTSGKPKKTKKTTTPAAERDEIDDLFDF
ncbi:hypothetical protein BC828DRAFT_378742 [Blastocladiella britannica]|nr:hypothetical protein BC828DRAFT_378742 [Blastocladiella britannica]